MRSLTLQDFSYTFPEHLVAQQPLENREHARLLVRSPAGAVHHSRIDHITSELPAKTLLILNDTRVFPSRLFGKLPTGGKVEVFLLEPAPETPAEDGIWTALGRPLKKMSHGTRIDFDADLYGHIVSKDQFTDGSAQIAIQLSLRGEALSAWLDRYATIPLPPYIKRPIIPDDDARSRDRRRYQTVFAKASGSVAAPTAGLHFSTQLLEKLSQRGCQVRYVCLHVGAGTFLPVKSSNIAQHKMHAERYCVPRETLTDLFAAKQAGTPVVAVGTTSFRCLESIFRASDGRQADMLALADKWQSTDLFVYPKTAEDIYQPWMIDGIITNFHQPCSTLFMLVSALIGLKSAQTMYAEAINQDYRLYSYGDASLLWLR